MWLCRLKKCKRQTWPDLQQLAKCREGERERERERAESGHSFSHKRVKSVLCFALQVHLTDWTTGYFYPLLHLLIQVIQVCAFAPPFIMGQCVMLWQVWPHPPNKNSPPLLLSSSSSSSSCVCECVYVHCILFDFYSLDWQESIHMHSTYLRILCLFSPLSLFFSSNSIAYIQGLLLFSLSITHIPDKLTSHTHTLTRRGGKVFSLETKTQTKLTSLWLHFSSSLYHSLSLSLSLFLAIVWRN